MLKTHDVNEESVDLSAEKIREQLELVVQDPAFRSSKRSVDFLRYVVDQTLTGAADQIKERTIGVEVFGRTPSYDTNSDHVVRTAAIELRKRLAIYYGDEAHRSELRMILTPGSYVPHFSMPAPPAAAPSETSAEILENPFLPLDLHAASPSKPSLLAGGFDWRKLFLISSSILVAMVLLAVLAYRKEHRSTAADLFWKPVLETPGPVLVAVGYVPSGPPTLTASTEGEPPLPTPHASSTPTVPYGDTVTIARVVGMLERNGRKVNIRRENSSSFSDLREGPVVLIGAFNNEWSLRLTHQLRYTLSLDAENHVIYIRDSKDPTSEKWKWATNQPTERVSGPGAPVFRDYALISRIWNSDTGHVVVVIGGLYVYGTETAGEFLDDPRLMESILTSAPLDDSHKNIQIVLGTTVTDNTPGPPKVLAVSVE